jgi:hypothetical protein
MLLPDLKPGNRSVTYHFTTGGNDTKIASGQVPVSGIGNQISEPDSGIRRYIPERWVTDYSGHIGNR